MPDFPAINQYEIDLFGAAVCDKAVAEQVLENLYLNDLYFSWTKQIYRALSHLIARGDAVNVQMVLLEIDCLANITEEEKEELKSKVCVLAESRDTDSVVGMIKRVKELSTRRQSSALFRRYADSAHDMSQSLDTLLTNCENELIQLQKSRGGRNRHRLNLGKAVWLWANNVVSEHDQRIPTGFPKFDALLDGGLGRGDLIVLAARPSMGKTSLAMNILQHVSFNLKKKALFFSLEMSPSALVDRYVSYRSNMRRSDFKNEDLLQKILLEFTNLPGDGDSSSQVTSKEMPLEFVIDTFCIDQIEMVAREVAREVALEANQKPDHDQSLGVIVLDYLQCVVLPPLERTNNRNYDVGEITKRLKRLAMELNVPLVVLSQMSRAIENNPNRKGNEPKLSDLRDSGEIENHADVIAFLQKRNVVTDQKDTDERPVELVVGKNRNGPTGSINCFFNGRRFYFREDRVPAPPIDTF